MLVLFTLFSGSWSQTVLFGYACRDNEKSVIKNKALNILAYILLVFVYIILDEFIVTMAVN